MATDNRSEAQSEGLNMATKQAGYQVDDDQAVVDVPREHAAPKVASRVTVNLSRRTVEALKATSALTDDTKTEVINKAVQLYREIQEAQSKGGGVFIQSDEAKDPVLVRFY
jgi:hypothetical protein